MNAKITPEFINELDNIQNQIFVFGSNTAGRHGAGAARTAFDKFDAQSGIGEGPTGRCYAIPTLDASLNKLPLDAIQGSINKFEIHVKANPELHFLITPIGTGLAGFSMTSMAILFAGFQEYNNVSLPQCFVDIIGTEVVHGYKAMNAEFNDKNEVISRSCRGFKYLIGTSYFMSGAPILCSNGFHFCKSVLDTIEFYARCESTVYTKVIGCGHIESDDTKICCNIIKIVEPYITTERDFNAGDWNTGNRNAGNGNAGNGNAGNGNAGNGNAGDWNAGNRNAGNGNAGNGNAGNRNAGNGNAGNGNAGNGNAGNGNAGNGNAGNGNAGNRNAGNGNAGNRNAGNGNAGNRNAGNGNAGNWNAGDWNAGNWNAGNGNAGDWNAGNGNAGMFNTITPQLVLFNKPTDKLKDDLYLPNWLYFDLVKWVSSNNLTDNQKAIHTYHSICDGALIVYDYKEAAQLSYNNATKEEQRSIEDLPNYDAEVLFEIFGIDRRKY